jgi:hypothetical protein
MSRLNQINLIYLFDFYLAVMLLVGSIRRFEFYRSVGAIMVAMPSRWPKLLEMMKQYRGVFLSRTTIIPALIALALMAVQMVCSRLIWPHARLHPSDLLVAWPLLPLVVVFGLGMIAVDVYFLVRIGRVNQTEAEQYFDQAEKWLSPWRAPVVRVLTLGYVNPRKIVSDEVQKAMLSLVTLLNRSLWWMVAQVGLRVGFGLSVWASWAMFVSRVASPQ